MEPKASLNNLAEGIRALNRSHPPCLEESMESYLKQKFREKPIAERLSLLEGLLEMFPENAQVPQKMNQVQNETVRILSLLSGSRIDISDRSPKEVSEKFAESLNTVFDTLNQIIAVIHSHLLGEKPELETIRHVIGSQIESSGDETSLQAYLEQIQQAFLLSHQAFQGAARSVVGEMLDALDPENLAASTKSIINFGHMRKSELFDVYQRKYQQCRKWYDAGRFSEKLLREFESICQKNYIGKQARGGS